MTELPPPPTLPTSTRRFSRRYVCEACGFKGRGSPAPVFDREYTDCPVCSRWEEGINEEVQLGTCRHKPQTQVLEQEALRQKEAYERKVEEHLTQLKNEE